VAYLKHLPDGKISDAGFEGANIVLYTKSKSFFLNNEGAIKSIVNKLKKRIELRPDPSIAMPAEDAKEPKTEKRGRRPYTRRSSGTEGRKKAE